MSIEPDELDEDVFDGPEEEVDEVDEVGFDEGGEDQDGPDRGEDDSSGEDEGQEGQPAQVGKQSRKDARIAAFEQSRKAAEVRAETAERRLAEIEQRSQSQQRQETEAQERDRLALMDPDQRTDYLLAKQRNEIEGRLSGIQFKLEDTADKTAFDALCSRSPIAAKLAEEVETNLAQMRRGGTTASREVVLRYLIGDRALKAAPRAKAKQQRGADAQRARQTARPGTSRSDTGGESRRGDDRQARAKRLENLTL